MPNRHLTRRRPQQRGRYAWARIPDEHAGDSVVVYRLFRRDLRNTLHCEQRVFTARYTRKHIAAELRAARRRLRDRVDDIDLAILGVAA
jgi:hypothetical protein